MAPNKRKILESARKYVQKGAKDKALKEYDKLLKLDPRDAKLRLEIGDAHRRWGQVDEAIAAYTKVAEQYMDEGFDARAVAVFKQIQGLDSERWTSYVPLAELYQRMGLNSEAVQSLQTAADGLHKAGEKRGALELLRKMATLDPGNTTSRIKIADLLRQEGMDAEAIVEYEAASTELERQGEHEAAEKAYERVLEIVPDRIATLAALARNLLGRNLGQRAEPFVKRALEVEPEETGHYELLADVYRAQNRDTELADTYRTLADIYRQRGDDDRAREIIQRFVPPQDLAPAVDDGDDSFTAAGDLLEEQLLDEEELLEDDEMLDDVELSEPAVEQSEVLDEVAPGDDDDDLLEDDDLEDVDELDAADELETGDDVLELGLDAGVEVSEDAPGSVPLPGAPSESDAPAPAGDPDQLLAEASVYLRYGKRAQAIRNLTAVLAIDADHRVALEKLGEAHADGGDTEDAVAAWSHAAELAHADGDAEAVSVLRDRVGALSPDAVSALPGTDRVPDEEIEELLASSRKPEVVEPEDAELEAPDAGHEAPAQEPLALDDDLEIDDSDLEDDIEIVLDDDEPLDDDDLGDDDELSGPLASDESIADDVPVSLQEAAAESSQTAGGSSASLSMSAQVDDDLEEAEFYRQQGLYDEADAIYRRVLEVAPNHPLALVRMGEIAAERGDDPVAQPSRGGPQAEPTLDEQPALEIDDELELSADAAGETPIAFAPENEADGDDALELSEEASVAQAAEQPDEAASESVPDPVTASTDEELFGADDEPAALADDSIGDDTAAELTLDTEDAPPEEPSDAGASFDLAAELSDFFDDDSDGASSTSASASATFSSGAEQDVFAAVFREFKKGVSEQLGEGDHEAHYDLGIAYREMGLLEDAAAEFQTAAKSDARRLECLHLLGLCTLDLGRGEEAVAHLRSALDSVDPTAQEATALRFDLGRAFESLERIDEARSEWEAVAAVDPSFCEVEERLALLGQEKPVAADDGMESFEDLFDDEDDASGEMAGATGEAVDAQEHESFEDLVAEANADTVPEVQPKQPAAGDTDAASDSEPEPEPEPTPKKRRKKKISFV